MKVTILVTRRPDIADPQGKAVERGLKDLGFVEASHVRINKSIALDVQGDDPDRIRDRVDEMCQKLLANPVMEDYEIAITEEA